MGVAAAAGAARAQPPDGGGEGGAEVAAFSHRYQFGLHLQGGIGYRGLFTYDEEYCGELKDDGTNKPNCLGRTPFGLDIGLSYGVTDRMELMVETRLGIERDIGGAPADDDGPRSIAIAPGIKGYIADIGPTQLFATLQFAIDFTGYDQIDEVDLGVRNVNGVQYDLSDNLGFYFFFGEQVSWRRWLRFEGEAGLGAQVRIP
jgi:hypothetical protein